MKESDWKENEISWDQLSALRERFLSTDSAQGADYWNSPQLLKSYDATFGARIGWKWDAVLEESWPRLRFPESDYSLLDWGCGTGRAARHWLTKSAPCEIYLWDRSLASRQWAQTQLRTEGFAGPIHLELPKPATKNLVVLVSHVANELPAKILAKLKQSLFEARAFFWVEPGTPSASQILVAVRKEALSRFSPVAPCPHPGHCGLLKTENSRHWCHHFASPPSQVFQQARWRAFSEKMGIDLRSLPVSFLVMEKTDAPTWNPDPRVIGRPRVFKGYADALVCTEAEVKPIKVLKKKAAAWFSKLKKTAFDLRLDRTLLPLLLGLLGGQAGAADPFPPFSRLQEPWMLSVYSTAGMGNLSDVTHVDFSYGDGVFTPILSRLKYFAWTEPCRTVFDEANRFSLQLMRQKKRISLDRYAAFSDSGAVNVHPDQLAVFEKTAWVPIKNATPFLLPGFESTWIQALMEDAAGIQWAKLRRAVLAQTSAQGFAWGSKPGTKPRWIRREMPWENDPVFRGRFAAHLASDELAWELGRAGEMEPALFYDLGRAAVFRAIEEMILYGGTPERSFLYAHALSCAGEKGYQINFGLETLPNSYVDAEGTRHCLMRRSLSSFLNDERFVPRNFYSKLRDLLQQTRYQLSDLDGLRLLSGLESLKRVELDYRGPMLTRPRHPPLVVYDNSLGLEARAHHWVSSFGVGKDYDAIKSVLGKYPKAYQNPERLYEDFGPNPHALIERNSWGEVSVMGLCKEEVLHNAFYLRAILTGFASYYERQLRQRQTAFDAANLLPQIQFVVYTHDADLSFWLQALGGKAEPVRWSSLQLANQIDSFSLVSRLDRTAFGHRFTFGQLKNFQKQLGDLDAEYFVGEGEHQARHELLNAMTP